MAQSAAATGPVRSGDGHVSLSERLIALTWTRVAIMLGTLLGVVALSEELGTATAIAVALFTMLFALDLGTRRRLKTEHRPSSRLLTATVLLEGLAISVALYAAGGASGPVRYALVIHAATTALLLSRQMGVRAAVWVSLLLLVSHEMQELGLVDAVDELDGSRLTAGPELIGLLVAIWITTLLTASASSINERVLLRERLEQHIHASFGHAAEAARAPVETARVLAEHVVRTTPLDDVLVLALQDRPRVLARLGGTVGRRTELRIDPGSSLAHVRDLRTPLHVRSLQPQVDAELLDLLDDPRNVSLLPMVAGDDVVGVLVVVHGDLTSRAVQRRTIEGLQRLASHGALALANAWAAEALDRQARTDGLTGVANRRVFDEQYDVELQRARRERIPISVVLCDVDHFKRFNDTHGHQVGDEVLAAVAATLNTERRPYDLVARYGGEEFVVILSQTDFDAAMRVAERFRRAVQTTGADLGVTASFGVATSEDGIADRTELLSLADECLYAAKENGRNRVEGARLDPYDLRPTGQATTDPRLLAVDPPAGVPDATRTP